MAGPGGVPLGLPARGGRADPGLAGGQRRHRQRAGVADDKTLYACVPRLIRYHLNEEPKIANVTTYLCREDADRGYVLDHPDELVIKPANESGGYGIFIGPRATRAGQEEMRARVEVDPRKYITQLTLTLSTAPTLCAGSVVPRHVDLRPFILSGERSYVTQGGLTRVGLVENSLIVNSSQGWAGATSAEANDRRSRLRWTTRPTPCSRSAGISNGRT